MRLIFHFSLDFLLYYGRNANISSLYPLSNCLLRALCLFRPLSLRRIQHIAESAAYVDGDSAIMIYVLYNYTQHSIIMLFGCYRALLTLLNYPVHA